MAYIGSNSINVFPSTRRTTNSASARQVTEANLVNLLNKSVDVESYVITTDIENLSGSSEFSFSIHGYLFTATYGDLIDVVSGASDIYATITLDTTSGVPAFYELDGQDNNNDYEGVVFSSTEPTLSANQYGLYLLHNNGDSWEVPLASQVKFSSSSVDISLIDGGVIS